MLEVRTRALRSLQFKLQHGLLPPDALARDKELLAALLGWFHYEADEPSTAVPWRSWQHWPAVRI